MKKLFFAIMAASVMASCSSDETIDVVTGKPIAFGNPFVENSTRTITDLTYTDKNLNQFNVYGTVTGNNNTVNIYNGDVVTGSVGDETWSCTKTQYWIPDASYKFIALVDATATKTIGADTYKNEVSIDANGFPISVKYDVRTQADLLFASHMIESATNNQSTVDFTFEHLLSKVMFTFTNGFSEDSKVTLEVKNITISNALQSAKYSYDATKNRWDWSILAQEQTAKVHFGNSSQIAAGNKSGTSGNIGVLIPGEYVFAIEFFVSHDKGGSDTKIEINTESIEIKQGNCYNFIAVLNSENVSGVMPIKFNITQERWDDEDENDVQHP